MFKTFESVKEFFRSHQKMNGELLSSFEEMLYETDMDAQIVHHVLARIKETISLKKEHSLLQVQEAFSQVLLPMLKLLEREVVFSEEPVVFDAIGFAQQREFEIICVDTAGRMHTHRPLMAEIEKIKRVIQKRLPRAPQEILIVVDANTGHNALFQSRGACCFQLCVNSRFPSSIWELAKK